MGQSEKEDISTVILRMNNGELSVVIKQKKKEMKQFILML